MLGYEQGVDTMAEENLVRIVAHNIHIVHGSGDAIRLYHYERPTELTAAQVEAMYGNNGEVICTVTELLEALRSIRDAR